MNLLPYLEDSEGNNIKCEMSVLKAYRTCKIPYIRYLYVHASFKL